MLACQATGLRPGGLPADEPTAHWPFGPHRPAAYAAGWSSAWACFASRLPGRGLLRSPRTDELSASPCGLRCHSNGPRSAAADCLRAYGPSGCLDSDCLLELGCLVRWLRQLPAKRLTPEGARPGGLDWCLRLIGAMLRMAVGHPPDLRSSGLQGLQAFGLTG